MLWFDLVCFWLLWFVLLGLVGLVGLVGLIGGLVGLVWFVCFEMRYNLGGRPEGHGLQLDFGNGLFVEELAASFAYMCRSSV